MNTGICVLNFEKSIGSGIQSLDEASSSIKFQLEPSLIANDHLARVLENTASNLKENKMASN